VTAGNKGSLHLLQLEPTDAHDFIKVTILQHISCYMFRSSLAHTVNLMKSSAFVGSNCKNCVVMHGMENAKGH